MISMAIWAVLTAGMFLWNATGQTPYIGVRFTDPPINGGWLGLIVLAYTVVRFFVRRTLDRRRSSRGQG